LVSSLIGNSQELTILGGHFAAVSFAKNNLHGFHHSRRKWSGDLFQRATVLRDRNGFVDLHILSGALRIGTSILDGL
jgi:hypothetical protein